MVLRSSKKTSLITQMPVIGDLRVISWNLLRSVGASSEDVAKLIQSHRPDLLLLQEATQEIATLPSLVGGHFVRHPMQKRIYGLAAWSTHPLPPPTVLNLPVSALPGRVPPRVAQIVQFRGVSFANAHLSHGQFLNRWQLFHIADSLEGPAAIIGDFNSVGPIIIPGFKDVGPRRKTHKAQNIIALRLDRCLVRNMRCSAAQVLEKGSSDHHPIVLDLSIETEIRTSSPKGIFWRSRVLRQNAANLSQRARMLVRAR